jgi:hypothetical protein
MARSKVPVLLPGDPAVALAATPKQYVDLRAVPSGGLSGQILTKSADTDYSYAWANPPAGTGGAGAAHTHPQADVLALTGDLDTIRGRVTTLEGAPNPVLAHEAASDPHAQYLNVVRGDARYAALSHGHTIANVTGLQAALDGKEASGAAAAAVSAHEAAGDPHPQYLTPAEGSAAYEVLGAASAARTAHEAAGDPHPGYLTAAEGNAAYVLGTDGRLTDARTPVAHNHPITDITSLQVALDGKEAAGTAATAVLAHVNEANPHPIYLTQTEGDALYPAITHVHSYEPSGTVATHAAAADPHPGYLTPAEGNAAYAATGHAHPAPDLSAYALLVDPRFVPSGGLTGQVLAKATDASHDLTWMTPASVTHNHNGTYELAGAAASARTAHEAAGDPHPGYLTVAEGDLAYAALSHNHAASAITSGTLAIARIPVGNSGTTVALGNDARFSDARTPVAHAHAAADITSGVLAFARIPVGATAATVAVGDHTHAGLGTGGGGFAAGIVPSASGTTPTITHGLGTRDLIVSVREVATDLIVRVASETTTDNDIRLTFSTAPTSGQYRYTILSAAATLGTGAHSHAQSEVTGLTAAIDGKAPLAHTHGIADTTSLQATLDGKAASAHVHDYAPTLHDHDYAATGHTHTPASIGASDTSHTHDYSALYAPLSHTHAYAPTVHTHAAADVASGTLAIARVPTGTTSTTVALGNHTHGAAAPAAHAASHATGGTDPITPAAIGAATSGHAHTAALVPFPPVDLTDAATIATNAATGNHFRVTLAADRALGVPTGATDGQRGLWEFTASAAQRTLTVPTGATDAFELTDGQVAALVVPSGKTGFLAAIYSFPRRRWTSLSFTWTI